MIITRKHDPIFHIENDNTLRFINVDIIDKYKDTNDYKIFDDKLYGSIYFKLLYDYKNDDIDTATITICAKFKMNYTLKEDISSGTNEKGTELIQFNKYINNKFINLKKITADNIIKAIYLDNPIKDDDSIKFYITEDNIIEMKECINIILDKIKEKL